MNRRAFLLGAASLALAPRALAETRRRPLALVTPTSKHGSSPSTS